MTKNLIFFVVALSLSLNFGCSAPTDQSAQLGRAPEEDPSFNNNPAWFGISGNMKYSDLAPSYSLPYIPWSGDYWATNRGGIATRWQGGCSGENCLYQLPSKQEYLAMSEREIAVLSPTEKYDLMNGNYNLDDPSTATGKERKFVRSKQNQHDKNIPGWTGICNGWSLAALFEDAPMNPVSVTNPDGLNVTFYEGDLKALISQVYFDYQPKITINRLGNGCFSKYDDDSYACHDINPKTWLLALHKYLAQGEVFVFDRYATDQVWNQPIYGYKDFNCTNNRLLSEDESYQHAAWGTVGLVDCTMSVLYITEGEPSVQALSEEQAQNHITQDFYSFTLELDENDDLVGGEWLSTDRPDFIWKPSTKPTDRILGSRYPIKYHKVTSLIKRSRINLAPSFVR